jgi:hypothetical protein
VSFCVSCQPTKAKANLKNVTVMRDSSDVTEETPLSPDADEEN